MSEDWNWAENRKNLMGHNFTYVGSGVIYRCENCFVSADLFNSPDEVKRCKPRKPQRKKACRHVWEYSENCWKRNICKKCLIFQKEPQRKKK